MIKPFDKIRLKSGVVAWILEVFSDGAYLAEVKTQEGGIDTIEISKSDIIAKIVEVDQPIQA